MKLFRHGPAARRVTLHVIALCALLLQVLTPVSEAVALDGASGVLCATDSAPSNGPWRQHHHAGGSCCILACVAFHAAYIATGFRLAFLPAQRVSFLAWTETGETLIPASLKFKFAARGPPSIR